MPVFLSVVGIDAQPSKFCIGSFKKKSLLSHMVEQGKQMQYSAEDFSLGAGKFVGPQVLDPGWVARDSLAGDVTRIHHWLMPYRGSQENYFRGRRNRSTLSQPSYFHDSIWQFQQQSTPDWICSRNFICATLCTFCSPPPCAFMVSCGAEFYSLNNETEDCSISRFSSTGKAALCLQNLQPSRCAPSRVM